jgi:hypothetical protein
MQIKGDLYIPITDSFDSIPETKKSSISFLSDALASKIKLKSNQRRGQSYFP